MSKKMIVSALSTVFIIAAFFAACSETTPSGPQPSATQTETATVSPTVTPTPTLYVRFETNAVRDASGDYFLAHVYRNEEPCAEATVVVSGSYVPHITSSLYRLNSVPYVYGNPYSVTITIQGIDFTETSPGCPGDAVIAADGLSATWVYEGNTDYLRIYAETSGDLTFNPGPDISAGITIDSATAYPVSDTYHLYLFLTNEVSSTFGNPGLVDPTSFIRAYELKTLDVVK